MTKDTQLKVGFFMIAKDKADVIETALNATKAVFDGYFLQDTGSSDNTVEIFEAWCKKHDKLCVTSKKELGKDYKAVYPSPDKPTLAEFGKARNDSFALNKGMNFAFWMDSDDIDIPGVENVHSEAVEMRKKGLPTLLARYDYAKRQGGMSPMTQLRERLIDLDYEGEWIGNVHEVYKVKDWDQMPPTSDKFSVVHGRKPKQVHETGRRNLLIMQMELGTDVYTPEALARLGDKVLQNLAFDHWEYKEYEQAIMCYEQLLTRGTGAHNEFFIHGYLVEAFLSMGNLTQAILHAGTAVAIAPDIAIPYLHLAKIYLKMGNWTEVEHYAQRVIQLGVPQITAPINEMDYIITPRQMLIEVEVRKGNLERAKEMMLELRKVAPGFDIRDEIRSIDLSITDNKAVKAYVDILRYLRVYNMTDTLDLFVKSIPKSLRNNSFLRNVIKEAKRDYKRKHEPVQIGSPMTIVLFAGNHFEHWDGHSDRKQGIGGSEGMTIQLMREIAKLGNKVTIYGNPEEEGMFDGVEYLNWQKWDAGIKCDIFICLRQPALFKERIIKAKKQYSWVHDTGYGDIAADVFYIPNKVTALSESHKEVLMKEHGIKDESIFWMTRNALNARSLKYAKKNAGERNKFQMIYASSYDRGLINALNMWPKIKEAVPEATLKIFYGWNTYDAMMNMRLQQGDPYGQHMHQLKQEIMEKITLLDGVYEYGRVSQDELYKEFAESDVWFYPTEFYEISCITAMQAQALGAVPVCTPVAALRETVNEEYGFKMNLDKIADGLIYLLQNHNELEGRREPMMKWATKAYDVKSLAKEWVEEFSS